MTVNVRVKKITHEKNSKRLAVHALTIRLEGGRVHLVVTWTTLNGVQRGKYDGFENVPKTIVVI